MKRKEKGNWKKGRQRKSRILPHTHRATRPGLFQAMSKSGGWRQTRKWSDEQSLRDIRGAAEKIKTKSKHKIKRANKIWAHQHHVLRPPASIISFIGRSFVYCPTYWFRCTHSVHSLHLCYVLKGQYHSGYSSRSCHCDVQPATEGVPCNPKPWASRVNWMMTSATNIVIFYIS